MKFNLFYLLKRERISLHLIKVFPQKISLLIDFQLIIKKIKPFNHPKVSYFMSYMYYLDKFSFSSFCNCILVPLPLILNSLFLFLEYRKFDVHSALIEIDCNIKLLQLYETYILQFYLHVLCMRMWYVHIKFTDVIHYVAV